MLLILDGWGQTQNPDHSAISKARTPFIDRLYSDHPFTELDASGSAVGLPEGQMGNSEVGHLTLGAGRVIRQNLARINASISDGSFFDKDTISSFFRKAHREGKRLHLLGLLSDGGVHSHMRHFEALIDMAYRVGLRQVFLHAFTDGRDVPPKSALKYIDRAKAYMKDRTGVFSSLIGRYYAMDRDRHWDRVEKAYRTLVDGEGQRLRLDEIPQAIENSYAEGVTDEFFKAVKFVDDAGECMDTIAEGDAVVFFNFRTDRGRQLTQALTQKATPSQRMKPLGLDFATMTSYDDTFDKVRVFFETQDVPETLGEVLSRFGKRQVRIAETEKYPHITFFFSGGRERPFEWEHRILCPSPQVATYDLRPCMSAFEIERAAREVLREGRADFLCINLANPDMVGHTGNINAVIEACEVVDACSEGIVTTAIEQDYRVMVVADHGNAERMIYPDGTPHTAHTTHRVPCFVIGKRGVSLRSGGTLADVAPSLLDLMGLPIPPQMTGRSLMIKDE